MKIPRKCHSHEVQPSQDSKTRGGEQIMKNCFYSFSNSDTASNYKRLLGVPLGGSNKRLLKWLHSVDKDDRHASLKKNDLKIPLSWDKKSLKLIFAHCIMDVRSTKLGKIVILCWPLYGKLIFPFLYIG